ncbi:hypothetical protein ACFQL7_20720 [Halocatena marina]|uniref:YopX protein domain-containing protein n=1 Tax=Halocatena marina TaxID=2934937 RepID=A0ABD5YGA8_9EURY|nr:hypothetical protein [Halocatena marina]
MSEESDIQTVYIVLLEDKDQGTHIGKVYGDEDKALKEGHNYVRDYESYESYDVIPRDFGESEKADKINVINHDTGHQILLGEVVEWISNTAVFVENIEINRHSEYVKNEDE